MKKQTKSFFIGLAVILPFLIPIAWYAIQDAMLPLDYKKGFHDCAARQISKGIEAGAAVCSCGSVSPSDLSYDKDKKRAWDWAHNRFFEEASETYGISKAKVNSCRQLYQLRQL